MFKKIAATISVTAFVMLCIALAPHVPTALATAGHGHGIDDVKAIEPVAAQTCASFEVWFLDPTCSQQKHAKKVGRLAHKASW
jgi:hypothetical protein